VNDRLQVSIVPWTKRRETIENSSSFSTLFSQLGSLNARTSDRAATRLVQLARMGEIPPVFIPLMIEMMRNPRSLRKSGKSNIRGGLAVTIGNMGEIALPFLLDLLCDPDPKMTSSAAHAISCLGERARRPVQEFLSRGDPRCEVGAMTALFAIDNPFDKEDVLPQSEDPYFYWTS